MILQCLYVLTAGNHLDTQQDKFSHPPEEVSRFEVPKGGDFAEARRRAERSALRAIRSIK
jgi:hypothetical protein